MILYFGNDFNQTQGKSSTMFELSSRLIVEGEVIKCYSGKVNRLTRMIHMILGLVFNFKSCELVLIDTFSTWNFYYAILISQLCRLLNIPYIPILHGGNLESRLDKSPHLSRLLFLNSVCLVSPSDFLKNLFAKYNYEVEVIHNIIPIDNYKFIKRSKVANNTILFVRSLKSFYNPKMGINVIKRLKSIQHDFDLFIVGSGSEKEFNDLKEYSKEMGVESQVFLTGFLSKPEWHNLSKKADIFINTSDVDNMPISVIEAMALGIPIISTDVGGMPYLIENNNDGILVPANDDKKMTEEVLRMYDSPELTQRLSLNARRKAEKFSWKVVGPQWIKLINENKRNLS